MYPAQAEYKLMLFYFLAYVHLWASHRICCSREDKIISSHISSEDKIISSRISQEDKIISSPISREDKTNSSLLGNCKSTHLCLIGMCFSAWLPPALFGSLRTSLEKLSLSETIMHGSISSMLLILPTNFIGV